MRTRRLLAGIAIGGALLAACSGDEVDDADLTTTTTAPTADTADDTTTTTALEADATPVGGAGDFTPGPSTFRVVNLHPDMTDGIDLYATTTDGQVDFYLLRAGLGYGQVLDHTAVPDPGKIAGFVHGTTNLFPYGLEEGYLFDITGRLDGETEGPTQTVVVTPEDSDDGYDVLTLWEHPAPDATTSNALPAAVDGQGVIALVNTVDEPTIKVADTGAAACRVPDNMEANAAVGHRNVAHFTAPPGTTSFQLHDWSAGDYECTEPPILTVDIDVEAGARVLVLVHADQNGELTTMQLPLT